MSAANERMDMSEPLWLARLQTAIAEDSDQYTLVHLKIQQTDLKCPNLASGLPMKLLLSLV
jgi:hypothetical protein